MCKNVHTGGTGKLASSNFFSTSHDLPKIKYFSIVTELEN